MSKITQQDCQEYSKLIEEGHSQRSACLILGLNRSTIQRYIKSVLGGDVKFCWLSVHTRATNDYSNKKMVAHCYNRYPLQPIKIYLQSCGVPIDEERYAVSSLLQFVWRSRIRKGEPIVLLIPNHRMCRLFCMWLNDDFEGD